MKTRRSSIFLPPSASVVKEERVVENSFDTKFSLPSFIRRVEKLTEDQRGAIHRTGFGYLLNIRNQMISKVLLGELMERWDSEKMTFKLLQGEVTITPQDVALILGLPVVGKSVEHEGPFSKLEREFGATPNNRKISISKIGDRLESIGGLVNEDFVRSFLLYTFGVFLFPNSSGKVDSYFLNLLEDLDKVHEYAWGEAVRQDVFSWIKKRKEENVKLVGGCLLLLQVWFYEHIDIGRPNLIASEQFPRARRWETIRSSYKKPWLSTKLSNLEEDQVTWVLEPTKTESEIDVVKQFLEAESSNEETSVDQSYEVTQSQCEESVDFGQEVVSASSDSTSEVATTSETNETAESKPPQIPNSDKDLKVVEEVQVVSEVSGYVSESPEVSSCTRDREIEGDEYLPSLSRKLVALQIQDSEELKKENAMLKDQVLLIPKLQEENSKLKEENADLKAEVERLNRRHQQVNASCIDLERLLSEYDCS